MSKPRPAIPSEMKRNIRARAGCGCVVCGKPIYEYHHINGFDELVGHIESEITLLCDGCHRKERNGLITRDYVIKCDERPFNHQQGHSTPDRVWYSDRPATVILDSCRAVCAPGARTTVLMLDGFPVLWLKEEAGQWLLNLNLMDPTHQPYVTIRDNELSYAITGLDVEYVGGRLTLRAGGEILFRCEFAPPQLLVTHGDFWFNGICVRVAPGGGILALPSGNRLQGGVIAWCSVAVAIGWTPPGTGGGFAFGAKKRLLPTASGELREVEESSLIIEERRFEW